MSESKQPNSNPPPSPPPQPKTLEQIIKETAPEVLETIPLEKRPALAAIRIEQHHIEMRSSVLPHPEELAIYNQIIPNGADRIMKMAEKQAAHRIAIEDKVVTSQQKQAFFGQICGLLIGLAGLGMATFAAVSGQPWFGGTIGGTTLIGLVSVFLYSRHSQKRELGQKQQQMQRPMTQNKKKN